IRVANTMRLEQLPVQEPDRLWPIYDDRLLREHDVETFLQIIPVADHLNTFRWLYPEASVREDRVHLYKFLTGRLQEAAGDRTGALSSYRSVETYLRKYGSPGPLVDRTSEGLSRLEKAAGRVK